MSRQTERDPYGGRNPREIPAYTCFDAAHYLRIPEPTIRNWVIGYTYPTNGGVRRRKTPPLIDIADARGYGLSFVNLLELHVLGALRREHHVRMRKVRSAIKYLQERLNSCHPLVDHEMVTDGTDIFVDEYGSLINASREGQLAMKALLHAYLRRMERNERGVAIRLFPFTRARGADNAETVARQPQIVSIDPTVAFGRPVIAGSRVPTIEVFERFNAGESPDELAEDFHRTSEEIWEAIRCEAAAA